jgi:anaerobic selenocysteine-containing dehydrogenase
MNRRKFLKLSAIAAVAVVAPLTVPQPAEAHVYEIDDGGDQYWWAARSEEEAEAMHLKHIREPARGHLPIPEDEIEALECEDGYALDVDSDGEIIVKTCGQWAADTIGYPVPLVACSSY